MEKPRIEIDVREAKFEDLETLVDIRIAAMRESLEKVGRFDPVRAKKRLTKDFQTENTKCFLHEKILVGFILVVRDNEDIVVKHLYVLPEFQNRGIGKMALDEIIEQGIKERRDIRLITLKESRANEFYLKNGFKHIKSIEFDNVYLKKWQETAHTASLPG
jgi:ribosomal protein S18 acetylase RimI-like enzyme